MELEYDYRLPERLRNFNCANCGNEFSRRELLQGDATMGELICGDCYEEHYEE